MGGRKERVGEVERVFSRHTESEDGAEEKHKETTLLT